jgi:hypothetical protein
MTSEDDARELLVGLLLGASLAVMAGYWWICSLHG